MPEAVTFLAIIDPVTSAFKHSGNNTGGKVSIAYDQTQLMQIMKLELMCEQLLKITVELADD